MPLPSPFIPEPATQRNFDALDQRITKVTDRAELTGARDDPEDALANLIALLEAKNILSDSTTDT